MKTILLLICYLMYFQVQGQTDTIVRCQEKNLLLPPNYNPSKKLQIPCDEIIVTLSNRGFLLTGFEKYGFELRIPQYVKPSDMMMTGTMIGYFDLKNNTDSIIYINHVGYTKDNMAIYIEDDINLKKGLEPNQSVRVRYHILHTMRYLFIRRLRTDTHTPVLEYLFRLFDHLTAMEKRRIADIFKIPIDKIIADEEIQLDILNVEKSLKMSKNIFCGITNLLRVNMKDGTGKNIDVPLGINFKIPMKYLKKVNYL